MWDWISKLSELKQCGTSAVLVTVTHCNGSTPRNLGARMIVLADGGICGTIGGGNLELLAIKDALRVLGGQESESIRYPLGAKTGQCCGGIVELLMEPLNQGPKLYLFGAGHVGQAICNVMLGTPFEVHIVDERHEWVGSPMIPSQVQRHEMEWDLFAESAVWDSHRTYVAIMTHRHDMDQEIVAELLRKPLRYLGLIGSHGKWAKFQSRLEARGYSTDELKRVTCPIGIDTGGKAPQEVAISLGAELLKLHYERPR